MNFQSHQLLHIAFAALTASRASTAQADNASQIGKGRTLYKTNCQTCHGEKFDGKGDAGKFMNPLPRNLQSDKLKNGESPEAIFQTITNGLPGTSMASFGALPESDRRALAVFIVSIRKK
jgi:high-affinity iron transporter